MRVLKGMVVALFVSLSISAMAQEKPLPWRIETVNGAQRLVLVTGRTTPSDNPNIIIGMDDDLWTRLDGLVNAAKGRSIEISDVKGFKVKVYRATVNSENGLIFSSGTKSVSIPKSSFDALKEKK